jgi:membrane associated rhomboid family serine protease
MTATSVGMRCPECAGGRTRTRGIGPLGGTDEPRLTYILIGINVAVALGTLLSGASTTGGGGIGTSSILSDGSVSRLTVDQGEYWRLVTAGFLHAGFFHLLFNMITLWILGTLLEPMLGTLRFGLIYFVSLLAGSFGALLLQPTDPTVGASGAIFGLMGAAVVVMRHRGMPLMESGLGLWLGLNLVITLTVPGISIGGHIGGLIGGALAAFVMHDFADRVRVPQLAANLIVAAIGVVSVAGAIAVSGSPG